jgi:hypothetical protein
MVFEAIEFTLGRAVRFYLTGSPLPVNKPFFYLPYSNKYPLNYRFYRDNQLKKAVTGKVSRYPV